MGLLLFKIFISDTDSEIKCTLSKFACLDDTKLSGAVDTIEGRDAMWRDEPNEVQQDHMKSAALGSGQSQICI